MAEPAADGQDAVLALLGRRETYPAQPQVTRIDTHSAIVFLAGKDVYKVKRAVRMPFLDYSTLERRRAACEAEVRVNAGFAPEIYLGTLPVTQAENGELVLGGGGRPVEWLVHMRRFDETLTLDHVTDRGELTPKLIAELARLVLASHERAPPGDGPAALERLATYVEQNDAAFRDFPELFPVPRVDAVGIACRAALARLTPLLLERGRAGHVRRCHGDLHLRNIVLIDGRPRLFDALEFDDAVATGDVLYDLAFLVMDLCSRGRRAEANLLMNRYFWAAAEDALGGVAALPLFIAIRAGIRAKVTAAGLAHLGGDRRGQAEAEAKAYFALAEEALAEAPPRLVVIGGLSGTGKSTLAAALAPGLGRLPGAIHVRSDVERKRMLGFGELDRLPPDAYGAEKAAAVYARIRQRAAIALRAGQSVVLDAVHARAQEREAAEAVAQAAGCGFEGLWLEAPRDVMESRVEHRVGDASDADAAVVRQQADYDVGEISWTRMDAGGTPGEVLERALRRLGHIL
jgi:aminoglycoside phosphotransferase family enzyme/predicted kinase